MRKIINKTLGLRDGEIFISFLMQLYIFIIITVLLIVKPSINALFISNLGADQLPYGYLLVAVTAVITTYFYSKAIRKFSLVKITVLSLLTFSIIFALLGFLLKYNFTSTFFLFFYYIFVSLFAVLATSQFWIFANMVFNAREAKRIFGFIGAGAIAGGIFGGYLTSLVASTFGKEYTIFIASILLLFCIPILKKIYNLRIRYLNTFKRKQIIERQDQLENSSVRLIFKSKHLTFLAFIVGISVIVAKLVDYQFSDFANKAISNSDDLTAFFGFWFSTFNVIALIIQLFFTNKVITKLGVSSSLLLLPLALGLGGLLFLTFPELWVLVIVKGIDGSFKQSLNKAAIELSIMPIPLQVKNQAKSYIDVAVDSIATGVAGFLLIFFIKKLNLSTSYISVIILFFVFVWIVLIYKLREAYFESFKANIQATLENVNYNKDKLKKQDSLLHIKNVLKSDDDDEAILKMFNQLKDYKLKVLQPLVIELLDHPSNKIKVAAISYLDAFDDNNILNKITSLVSKKDDVLVYVALEYILVHSPITEKTFFNTYLDHQDEYVSNGAILALAKQSQHNQKLANTYSLKNRLKSKIEFYTTEEGNARKEIIAGLLLSIAYTRFTNYYSLITDNLKSEEPYNIKFAAIAAGITSHKIFIDDLLKLLKTKQHRKKGIKALKSYGPRIINVLLDIEYKDELEPEIKKNIPKIVAAFKNRNALKILKITLKSKNTTTRLETSKAFRRLKRNDENLLISAKIIKRSIYKECIYHKSILEIMSSIEHHMNLELMDDKEHNKQLIEARKKIYSALEIEVKKSYTTLFNLLSLLYNENDVKIIQKAINSGVREAKINAIELLENLLERNLRAVILPLLEYQVAEKNTVNTLFLNLTTLKEVDYLKKIMNISGSSIKHLVISYVNISNSREFIPVLLPLKKYRNRIVGQFAYDTYVKLLKNMN